MQNAAKISPTNFRVMSVLGTKRQGDETARGRNGKGTKRQGDETAWDQWRSAHWVELVRKLSAPDS
jgi:hypothetical protein